MIALYERLNKKFSAMAEHISQARGECTLVVKAQDLIEVAKILRDDPAFQMTLLVDLCGVDYLHYGLSEWETARATSRGFERGVQSITDKQVVRIQNRFAVVIHLLSIHLNERVRVRVFLDEENPKLPSVTEIWPAALWYEREAFDLFGIMFENNPDLRRLLTDYGFVGHPFRKDFPQSGYVEPRYDALLQKVVYEPVSITPRVLEPKVIRHEPVTGELPK